MSVCNRAVSILPNPSPSRAPLAGFLLVAMLIGLVAIQHNLEARYDRTTLQIEELAQLPNGEHLKPALLGYHHLGADVLWLRMIQVLGKRKNTMQDYEWMYHALDVITDLDPQYDYAYQVGGLVLSWDRVDLANKLLEKGLDSNPHVWLIPFYLGMNHFMYTHDYQRAAQYIDRASRISVAPGELAPPPHLPLFATRLYAQSGDPDSALELLSVIVQQTPHDWIKPELEGRVNDMIIERDIRALERAVLQYRQREKRLPHSLSDLDRKGDMKVLPQEPFGGTYILEKETGRVNSSMRPERLRVRPQDLARPRGNNQ
jgi:tetratricopeptide (TPR) repeat protein